MTEYEKYSYRFTFNVCSFCKKEIYDGDILYDISELIGKTRFVHKDCLFKFIDFNKNLIFDFLFEDNSLQSLMEQKLPCFEYRQR